MRGSIRIAFSISLLTTLITLNIFGQVLSKVMGVRYDTVAKEYKLWSKGAATYQIIDTLAAWHHIPVVLMSKWPPTLKIYGEFNIKDLLWTLRDLRNIHRDFDYLITLDGDHTVMLIKKRRKWLPRHGRYSGFRRQELSKYIG